MEPVEQRVLMSASLQYRAVDAAGGVRPPVTFESPAAVLVQDFAPQQQSLLSGGFAAPAFDLFLEIDGIDGESTDAKHKDAIELLSLSWGGDLPVPADAGGGSGASRPEFHELHLASRVSAASPLLLDRLNNGQHIPDARLFVRRPGGKGDQEFVRLDLDDVLVSSYQVTTDAVGLVEEFTLNFDRVNLEYLPVRADGSLGPPVEFDSGQGLRVQEFDPRQRSLLDAGVASPADVDFFLHLDGVPGESTDAKHKDAIEVLSFSWGADHTGAGTGGGAGASRAQFEELHVVSRVSNASPVLLQRMASGQHIPEGELVARKAGKDQLEFYRVSLDDVLVSSYEVTTDGAGLVEEFTLNFREASFTYVPQRADGSPGAPVEFATGTAGVLVEQFAPEQRSLIQSGFAAPAGVDFFLKVDGVPGESADAKHKDEIDVLSFSWGADQTGGSSSGGGGGAGVAEFQELHVVSRLSAASPRLLGRMTTGQHIPDAVLVARRAGGKDQTDFLTLTLDDVQVSSYQVSAAPDGTLLEEFTLAFDRAREQYRVQRADGTSSPGASFDSGPGTRVEDSAPAQVSLLQGGFADTLFDVHLDIDGIPGESADAKHKDAIDVLSFSWGGDHSADSNGGGGGAGRATLHELHVASRVSKATPLLLDRLTDGQHIPGATLSVARPGSKGPADFLRINLDDVLVSSYQVAPRNGQLVEEFTLSFGDVEEEYQEQNPDGSLGQPVSFDAPPGVEVQEFDAEQRSLLQSGFGTLDGTVRGFLSVTGIPGESTDAKHKDQIEVLSFSWGANQTGGTSTGGGAGGGRADFHELHVVSRVSRATPLLLDRMAKRVHIPQADLSFVRSGKDQTEFLRVDLDDVLVGSHQMIQQPDGSVLEEFTLVFDEAETRYRQQNPDGTSGAAIVFATGPDVAVEQFTPEQASLLELGRVSSGPTDLFLRVEGVQGESEDAKHRNEIDVQSFSWGGHHSGGTSTGGGAGAGSATLHEVHVVTRLNAASPRLLERLADGEHIPDARLVLRRGGLRPVEFLTLNLEDVTVSSYRVTTALDGTLLEEYTLHFAPGAAGNRQPVANADTVQTPEDLPLVVDVLANDTDPDGDLLTVTGVGAAAHGAVTLNDDGTVTYTPQPNFNGTDAFTYTASDGRGGSDTATVTVTVTPVNDKPLADPQTVTVTEDGSVSMTLSGSDVETAAADLVFTVTRLPDHGLLSHATTPVDVGDTFIGPPTLTYEPGLCAEPGADSFGFTVTDTGDPTGTPGNLLTSDAAGVTLNVTPAVADGSLSFSNGVLRIGGTGGTDTVTVSRSGPNLIVSGSVTGQVPLAEVTEIRAWGRGGDDALSINVDIPTFVSGGLGDDHISGGSAFDWLLGGDGDDKVGGAPGDDVLVGGVGKDRLVGASGDDVLIGGALACHVTLPALRLLGAGWSATYLPAPGLRLTGQNADVSDSEIDHLTGASGADWFVVSSMDTYQDARPGRKGDALSILS